MTRKEFIDRIIAIYRLKYKPSDLEVDEFRLALELMPDSDKPSLTVPVSPITTPDPSPNPYPWWRDTVVMYGCPMPNNWNFDKSNSSSTFVDSPIEGLKLKENKEE